MEYYISIWPYLALVSKDRPLSLVRYPEGIEACFFTKTSLIPALVETLLLTERPAH